MMMGLSSRVAAVSGETGPCSKVARGKGAEPRRSGAPFRNSPCVDLGNRVGNPGLPAPTPPHFPPHTDSVHHRLSQSYTMIHVLHVSYYGSMTAGPVSAGPNKVWFGDRFWFGGRSPFGGESPPLNYLQTLRL